MVVRGMGLLGSSVGLGVLSGLSSSLGASVHRILMMHVSGWDRTRRCSFWPLVSFTVGKVVESVPGRLLGRFNLLVMSWW